MQTRPSSITGSWSPASRTSKSLSLQRHSGEECGRYWIHCRRHRGAVARILVMDDDGTLREVIRALRAEHPQPTIVAMSGGGRTGQIEVLEAAAALGASRTLVKPFEPRQLLKVIRELLGERAVS